MKSNCLNVSFALFSVSWQYGPSLLRGFKRVCIEVRASKCKWMTGTSWGRLRYCWPVPREWWTRMITKVPDTKVEIAADGVICFLLWIYCVVIISNLLVLTRVPVWFLSSPMLVWCSNEDFGDQERKGKAACTREKTRDRAYMSGRDAFEFRFWRGRENITEIWETKIEEQSVREDGGVRGNRREVNGKNVILGQIIIYFFLIPHRGKLRMKGKRVTA